MSPTPADPAGQGTDDIEIFKKGGRRVGGLSRWGDFAAGSQKQLRILQDPLPDTLRAVAPGRVEFRGLACGASMGGQGCSRSHAVLPVDPGHGDQEAHGYVGAQLPAADLFLNLVGKQLHQRQPAADPARAAVKAAGQLFQGIAEPLVQFRQQPALFQRRVGLPTAQ